MIFFCIWSFQKRIHTLKKLSFDKFSLLFFCLHLKVSLNKTSTIEILSFKRLFSHHNSYRFCGKPTKIMLSFHKFSLCFLSHPIVSLKKLENRLSFDKIFCQDFFFAPEFRFFLWKTAKTMLSFHKFSLYFSPSDNKSWKKMCYGKSWIGSLRSKGWNYSGVLQWSFQHDWKKSRTSFNTSVFQEYPKIRLFWPMWKASNKSNNSSFTEKFLVHSKSHGLSQDFCLPLTNPISKSKNFTFSSFRHFTKTKTNFTFKFQSVPVQYRQSK